MIEILLFPFFLAWGLLHLLGILFVFALYVASVVWVFADANRRDKPGCLVALIVAIPPFWPWSLLVWLIFRPRSEHAH